jgi:hypothetical protein
MNHIPDIVREAEGDRGWRGFDVDKVFSRPELSDDALTASEWCARKFSRTFPGWQLYRRVNAGMHVHDNELDAWVVGGARMLARARRKPTPPATVGRCYIEKRGPWIDQAARDALATVIRIGNIDLGAVVPAARARGAQFGIKGDTWLKIYRPMLACLVIGLNSYASELHYQYRQVKMVKPETDGNLEVRGSSFAREFDFQTGNRIRRHALDSDILHAQPMPDVLK